MTSSQEFRGDNKPEWAPLVVTPQSRLPLLWGAAEIQREGLSLPRSWQPSHSSERVPWTMACWFRPVISPKVRQWVCFSHEMKMLLEECQCYWKLLVAETHCSDLKGRPKTSCRRNTWSCPRSYPFWASVRFLDSVRYSCLHFPVFALTAGFGLYYVLYKET